MRCLSCTSSIAPLFTYPDGEDQSLETPLASRVWASFAELESQGDLGCDLCTLVRQYLTNHISYVNLNQSQGEIKLHRWTDEQLGLNCTAFHGTILVPIVNDTTAETWRDRLARKSQEIDIYAQASKWLRQCLSGHKNCQDPSFRSDHPNEKDGLLSRLPKRLIDLAHHGSVLVIDCAEWAACGLASLEDLQEYCTLSYRWGSTSHNCALERPFNCRLEFAIDEMPQTFIDAITVARRLRIRFLWIDALCIVQPSSGNNTDWLEE